MKKLLHYGAFSLALGFVLLLTVYFMTGGNLLSIAGKSVMKQTEFSVADVKNLELEVPLGDVEVVGTDQDKVTVDYPENDKVKYKATNQNGTLTIKSKQQGPFFIVDVDIAIAGLINLWNNERKVTIKLPREQLEELNADVGAGTVTIEDLLVKGNSKLEADLGSVSIDRTDFQGNVTGEIGSGTAEFSQVTARMMDLSSDLGSLNLEDVHLREDLSAELGSGSLDFDRLSAGRRIELTADLGSISGDLMGRAEDYNITSETDLGSNNLPNGTTGGSKDLNVSTGSGSIDIQFVE